MAFAPTTPKPSAKKCAYCEYPDSEAELAEMAEGRKPWHLGVSRAHAGKLMPAPKGMICADCRKQLEQKGATFNHDQWI